MKVDPELIKVVAGLPDEELWITIRSLAKMKKIKLSETVPPHATMETLRQALKGADKMDLSSALRLINQYKDKNG